MPDFPSPDEIAAARDVMFALTRAPGPWPTHDPVLADLVRLAARVVSRDRKQQTRDAKARDADLRDSTEIRTGRPTTPAELAIPVTCYACRRSFDRLHAFYDTLCPACATEHTAHRNRSVDLTGRVALVTGGRVKSGFRVVLKLLRAGAEVIATTRFPADAAIRFAAESDASTWADRLRVVGLDLRMLPDVARFAAGLRAAVLHLDIFVANAAQTVRRPPAFYRRLAEAEKDPAALPALAQGLLQAGTALVPASRDTPLSPAELALVPLLPADATDAAHFPGDERDADGHALDLRPENSWSLTQEAVSTVELAEVHAVNCLAPFVLLRELRPLFRAGLLRDRFAVIVSAAEGRFSVEKTGRHPHTNMAKAAVNMLVRTSATEFAADRVFLTAVDPGWFSVQSAAPTAGRFAQQGGRIPLDAEEAAARILHPVFDGIATGDPASGVLFKDYRIASW